MAKFGDDGRSVILEDGRVFPAAAVVLATGYESTWRSMFDSECVVQLRRAEVLMGRGDDGTTRLGSASP